MLQEIGYDRFAALRYAYRWAYRRNPQYCNFDGSGGDCSNFISQCLFAGCEVMNNKHWYCHGHSEHTPSWVSVEQLYRFLISNQGEGPHAEESSPAAMEIGDIIQFGKKTRIHHSTIITGLYQGQFYVTTHSKDVFMKPLDQYEISMIRYLHIKGARKHC